MSVNNSPEAILGRIHDQLPEEAPILVTPEELWKLRTHKLEADFANLQRQNAELELALTRAKMREFFQELNKKYGTRIGDGQDVSLQTGEIFSAQPIR